MTEQSTIEQDEVGVAMGRLLSDFASTASTVLVTVGLRTGLWDAVAAGPGTADDLARRAGVAPPYAREWLRALTAAGYLTFDPRTARFDLVGGFGAVMAGSLRGLAEGTCDQLAVWWGLTDRYEEVYRTGAGISWAALPAVHAEAMDQISRAVVVPELVESWLPAIEGVTARLAAGGRVADVGCGYGAVAIALAQAFPSSRCVGVDLDDASVSRARSAAIDAGVSDRVTFEVSPAADLGGGPYDLVVFADSLHDFGRPQEAGDAGIGKTALVSHVAAEARDELERVAWGRAIDGLGSPAYWLWTQVLRQLGLLAEGEHLGEAAWQGPVEAGDSRFRLFEQVVAALDQTGRSGGLLVVLDDLHWADADSLALLERVGHSLDGRRLTVIGIYRDTEAGEALQRLARTAAVLTLEGLTVTATEELMSDLVGHEVTGDEVARMHRRTGGNPFFVRELTRLSQLRRESGQGWDTVAVVDSVRDVIERRLARLSQPCARLLVAAAMDGAVLRPWSLHTVLDEESDISDLVEEALAQRILTAEAGTVRFGHDLFREVILASLPPSARRQAGPPGAGPAPGVGTSGREAGPRRRAGSPVRRGRGCQRPGDRGGGDQIRTRGRGRVHPTAGFR